MEQTSATISASATNLIFYGPPGTGKTFTTAAEAVRLCGEPVPQDRAELTAVYQRLVAAGRIEFVTFHRSMSYEEFVEGLRPETAGDAGDESPEEIEGSTIGFRLKPHDGVFKRLCQRAEQDRGENVGRSRLDPSRRIFRLGLTGSDWKEKFQCAITENVIEWRHGGAVDWSDPEYENWEAIKARQQQTDPDRIGNHPCIYGTWLFRSSAETGEYIALTVGRRRIVAVGKLVGDYFFEPERDGKLARHPRPVEWLWSDPEGVDRDGIYDKDFTAYHTMYPFLEEHLDKRALEQAIFGKDAPSRGDARAYVLIIDEINRANISKVFGDLITLLEPDKRLGAESEIRLVLLSVVR